MPQLKPGETTIGVVRLTAQQQSQMQNNPVVQTPEWNGYVQESLGWLYGVLVDKFGQNYAQKILIFLTDGQTSLYDLPDATYKLTKVDFQIIGAPLQTWSAAERVELSVIQRYDLPVGNTGWTNQVRYALMGEWGKSQQLWLAPVQPQGRQIRLIYVPRQVAPTDRGTVRLNRVTAGQAFTFTVTDVGTVTLTAGTDFAIGDTDLDTANNLAVAFNAAAGAALAGMFEATVDGRVVTVAQLDDTAAEIGEVAWSQMGGHLYLSPLAGWTNLIDGVNGWQEILVVDAAIKALGGKQNRDTSEFWRRRAELVQRIEEEAANRDAGAPVQGADTLGIDAGGFDDFGYGGFGDGGFGF